jgi:hypothetical protein
VKKTLFLLAVVSLFVSLGSFAQAQDQSYSSPPKVIRIGREEVKVGRAAAHEVLEAAWARSFADAKSPDNWIGMDSTTGNNEVWFVSGYNSMSEMEKTRQALDTMPALKVVDAKYSTQEADFLSGLRTVVAVYRDDLSYQGVKTNVGTFRYLYVTTVRIRPGHDADFVEATKISRAAHEKAAVPERWSVFEVTEGMPHGTYLIFEPLKSMADVDAFPLTHGKPYQDAVGDEGRKRLAELNSAATISAETNIFAFNPKMSNPTKEITAADPGFWTPKPVKKAALGANKGAEKPAGN